ncbi:hypothetical protein AVEN_172293-1 [Araneus ventricosus]|uniref:Uncharacterized protein n=1 Tax=Araneus ventricosus TaxID=182803 RepID=A0A4Y2FNP8_ARAVE|nr:hypothetical protein AVEN_172293-1 [Araneus ventricosus]
MPSPLTGMSQMKMKLLIMLMERAYDTKISSESVGGNVEHIVLIRMVNFDDGEAVYVVEFPSAAVAQRLRSGAPLSTLTV